MEAAVRVLAYAIRRELKRTYNKSFQQGKNCLWHIRGYMYLYIRRLTSHFLQKGIIILVFALFFAVFIFHGIVSHRQMNIDSKNLLTLIGELRMHDRVYGKLPDAIHKNASGVECCSWRLVMLDHLTQTFGYDINQPWDSEANNGLISESVSEFCYKPLYSWSWKTDASVVCVVGAGTPFQEKGSLSLKKVDEDTIILVQAATHKHWMEPYDLRLKDIDESTIRGLRGDGVLVGFADGEVWKLSPNTPVELFKTFLVARPLMARNKYVMLKKYCVKSWHSDF